MIKMLAASLAVGVLLAAGASAQTAPAAKPVAAAPAAPAGEDRYVGYYYPKPTSTEVFESTLQTVAEDATFFDLLKLLGFQSVTIPDGDKVTHQVTIK